MSHELDSFNDEDLFFIKSFLLAVIICGFIGIILMAATVGLIAYCGPSAILN